ncbi:MAG: hypothetical protein JWN70_5583 [Planctomycetaceae bacterium]|nr:hypothetical protein [Planctomycetaceae bacterium]
MNLRFSACVLGCALFVVGCGPSGPELYSVKGEVKYDSQPLATGDIIFEPTDSEGAASGGAITQGKYSIKALPGKYKVKINASREIPGKMIPGPSGGEIAAREDYIPAKFNTKTELTAEVDSEPENTINFEMAK